MARQPFEQPDPTYSRLVEQYSMLLISPTEKLKFLRAALEKYQAHPLAERIGWLKQIVFRKTIIEELVRHLPADVPKPREISLVFWLYRIRYPFYFTATLLIVLSAAVTIEWTYGAARDAGVFDLSFMKPEEARSAPPAAQTNAPAQDVAPQDETKVEGFTPDKIWIVERGNGYELYSNGGRILTAYETSTEKRSFYALMRKQTKKSQPSPVETQQSAFYPEFRDRPMGILYHTTQSDILPFSARYNQSIKSNTDALLEYVRQEKLYNYMIDRFGRIYRLVRDEDYANHAGNSIWSDDEAVYINLNHSFIGVAFEGWWSADLKFNPDQINEAQLYAGKVLTEILRSKFAIRDSDCVTHGMVSINPSKFLIGYHMDWATGFPFAKMKLSDKYEQPTPSISEFGFKYDRTFVNSLDGRLWSGIDFAEARLKARAADIGLSAEALRRQLQSDYMLYRQWLRGMREQARAEGKTESSEPEDIPEKPLLLEGK